MSLDPSKWTAYDKLSQEARGRIEVLYPYLKIDQAQFQEKKSGVFVRHTNTGKVEKLLEPPRPNPPPQRPAPRASSGGRSRR